MQRTMKPWQRAIASPIIRWRTPGYMYRTTYDVLSELTSDQDLIATICGQWGDMGLPPKQSAFMVHAMIARHYLYGGFYPVGGSWRIAESIIPKIQQTGGEVFTYAKVTSILVEDGRVTGVEMDDGHRIECDTVVSSAGVANTFGGLLPEGEVERTGYSEKLDDVRPSFAHLGVYIGLQGTAEEHGLPKTNFWIYPHNDYDAAVADFVANKDAEFPVVYISFPSRKTRRTWIGIRERPRLRSWRRRPTSGSSSGAIPRGASAATTTRRSRRSLVSA